MREIIAVGSDETGHIPGNIVYFAQRQDTGLIKIGTTSRIKLRLNMIITKIKASVICLGALPGGTREEREYHCKFSEFSLGHEWFTPAPVLLDFIKRETMEIEFRRSIYGRPCRGKTRLGAPCNAPCKPNTNFCYHHQKSAPVKNQNAL